MNKSISLVFPVYNEHEYLPITLKRAVSVLGDITSDYEIIVVNDASTDESGCIAEDFAMSNKKIKVLHHYKNRKLGGALKSGFSNATKDIIIYTDIDLPFNLSILKDMLPLIDKYDIVKGYRTTGRECLLRAVYSKVYNSLVNLVFNLNVRDVNFALKIFKRDILNKIELKSEGSFISAEFLSKAKRIGCSIGEVGVEYTPRRYGFSRLSSPAVILKILYEMALLFTEIKTFSRKNSIFNRVKKFYKNEYFSTRVYNAIRFKTCPFDRIEGFIPDAGEIVDIGCGTGLFINILRTKNEGHKFYAFDRDDRKIRIFERTFLGGHNSIIVKKLDVSSDDFSLPRTKCIILIDVLYYLNRDDKRKLLSKAFNALESDGLIVIKDIDKSVNLKFLWTYVQEYLAVKLFSLTSAKGLYFEKKIDYLEIMMKAGFNVEIHDLSKGYFYPHVLFIGKRPNEKSVTIKSSS
ncbi:MAG: glycosyltransferase [Candidatus Atribacteria bacterium]|nr:glycosyltransferase [Candidatus Atribacteria bacterium]